MTLLARTAAFAPSGRKSSSWRATYLLHGLGYQALAQKYLPATFSFFRYRARLATQPSETPARR